MEGWERPRTLEGKRLRWKAGFKMIQKTGSMKTMKIGEAPKGTAEKVEFRPNWSLDRSKGKRKGEKILKKNGGSPFIPVGKCEPGLKTER